MTEWQPPFTTTCVDQPGDDYPLFEEAFERLSGIRLGLYKEKQMKRRINTLILRKKMHSYRELINLMEKDPAELRAFIDYITINVTEFFRTQEQWSVFEKEALSDLICHGGRPLTVWSCACASGDEPYSLAMSLLKNLRPEEFRILASDLDERVLEAAKKGTYDERTMESVPEELKEKYFVKNGSLFTVSDELRNCVDFRRLDLLQDEYPVECDLIVCRNILIYFTEEAKQMIYERLLVSLAPGGYLFTGNTEQIIYYKALGYEKVRGFLYRKPQSATRQK